MTPSIPIYLFSGFFGSGKTTLLMRTLAYWTEQGKRPAVIMNELGEANIDGLAVEQDLPMKEILGDCICCSAGQDVTETILELQQTEAPDAIIIESTGVANPRETITSVTEASLKSKVDLRMIVTVVDAAHYLSKREGEGKLSQLLGDQIGCADLIILNKADLIAKPELEVLRAQVRAINGHALIKEAVYCQIDPVLLEMPLQGQTARAMSAGEHSSHQWVSVYTHFFHRPLVREAFEQFIRSLPEEVYRAKGIVQFTGKKGPMLFQYAHGVLEMIRVTPKEEGTQVAVFIGEPFSREDLASQLEKLTAL